MLQMLVQNLQFLHHNHQQQVDIENYMNYMLLNPTEGQPWQPCSGVFFAAFCVFCGGSTAPLTGPAYVIQRLQRFRAVSCGSTAPLTYSKPYLYIINPEKLIVLQWSLNFFQSCIMKIKADCLHWEVGDMDGLVEQTKGFELGVQFWCPAWHRAIVI